MCGANDRPRWYGPSSSARHPAHRLGRPAHVVDDGVGRLRAPRGIHDPDGVEVLEAPARRPADPVGGVGLEQPDPLDVWPLSSHTSRCSADTGASPGSSPPPGSVHRPGAEVSADSSVSRTPRVAGDDAVGRGALVGARLLPGLEHQTGVGGHRAATALDGGGRLTAKVRTREPSPRGRRRAGADATSRAGPARAPGRRRARGRTRQRATARCVGPDDDRVAGVGDHDRARRTPSRRTCSAVLVLCQGGNGRPVLLRRDGAVGVGDAVKQAGLGQQPGQSLREGLVIDVRADR